LSVERSMQQRGIVLPPKKLGGGLVSCKQVGELVYISGHGPFEADGSLRYQGAVGRDLTVEEGCQAARQVGLNLLASLRAHLGSLDRVEEVVKVLGWVQCPDGFADTPAVMNGFSDLMMEVFGERGRHARSAIGTNALPGGIAVEVECIVRVQ
jgi:enamine deaminase RidA (YjgF/YER057c/UK114 family)